MDDLISRAALCEYALNQKDKSITANDIMRFPSVQKRSKWINGGEMVCECDKCGYRVAIWAKTNYCANCGADMRGETDE